MMSKSTKKKLIATSIVLIVAAVAALGALYYLGYFEAEEPEEAPVYHSQLTGLEVEREESERPVLAVIIENTPAARPQTGLNGAGIVFEILTEGGITRTLALYQESMPETVGPIRSLRPYFVDAVMGFDASVAHVGGSAEALRMAEERGAKSLDQFRYSDPYYRTEDRVAPHNMYASTEDLRELQAELDHGPSSFSEIPRSDDNPAEEPPAATVTVDYSGPVYLAEFRYRPENNDYSRYLAGEPHVDAVTDEPVTVKNLIVIKLPSNGVDIVGGGEALVFKNGRVREVRWQKTDHNQRLEILDNEGNQVPLNRGRSWFVVIPEDRPVTY